MSHNPGKPKPYALRYEARVRSGGKKVHLGSLATAEEAALCVVAIAGPRPGGACVRRRSGRQQARARRRAGAQGPGYADRRSPQGGGCGPAHAPPPTHTSSKEEELAPPMPPGAFFKEEERSMPPDAVVKEDWRRSALRADRRGKKALIWRSFRRKTTDTTKHTRRLWLAG